MAAKLNVSAIYSDGTTEDVTKQCRVMMQNKYIVTVTNGLINAAGLGQT